MQYAWGARRLVQCEHDRRPSGTSAGMTSRLLRPSSAPRPRRILVCTPLPLRLDARHGLKAEAQRLLRVTDRNEVALLCLRPADQEGVDPAFASRFAALGE